jgi:hypothetical protein
VTNHPIPPISNPQSTTTGQYSGDVIINLRNLLSDIDLSPLFESWKPLIRTQFLFRSGKLAVSDTDESNDVNIVVDDIADTDGSVTLHIPAITENDTIAVLDKAQILSNKVISDSALGSNLDVEGFNLLSIGNMYVKDKN